MRFAFVLFLFCWPLIAFGSASLKSSTAAIATPHALATQAAEDTLRAGGNAFDAAVSTAAVLAVVQPFASGLGGGGWWLLKTDKGEEIVLDSREAAPAHLPNPENITLDQRRNSLISALIPGEPAALVEVNRRFGRLPLKDLLAPAIYYAQHGFAIDARYRFWLNDRKSTLLRYPSTKAIFFNANDEAKAWVKQPELANTLKALAERGHAGFYAGPVARGLVAGLHKAGGVWTLQDLSDYKVKERNPLSFEFEGFKVTTIGAPSAGGYMMQSAFSQLSEQPWKTLGEAQRMHLIAETLRRASCERGWIGDPDFVKNPDEVALKKLRTKFPLISMEKATPSTELSCKPDEETSQDTTHFSIHDQEGNRVSVTTSNNFMFGSGFIEPSTGLLLNNHLDDFTFEKGSPNYPIKAHRPLSTMAPLFLDNECLQVTLGTPGGFRIASMHTLALLNFIEKNDLTSAIAAPRFHQQWLPDQIEVEEKSFSPETLTTLRNLGHNIVELDRHYGDMQAVLNNTCNPGMQAVSDPRGVGKPLIFSVPE